MELNVRRWVGSCLRKHRYKHKQHAVEMIRHIEKIRNVKLKPYYCKYCLGWHLTHTHIKGELK